MHAHSPITFYQETQARIVQKPIWENALTSQASLWTIPNDMLALRSNYDMNVVVCGSIAVFVCHLQQLNVIADYMSQTITNVRVVLLVFAATAGGDDLLNERTVAQWRRY